MKHVRLNQYPSKEKWERTDLCRDENSQTPPLTFSELMALVRINLFSRAVDATELSSQREHNMTFKFIQSSQEPGRPWSPEKQRWLERVMEWIQHMPAEQEDTLQQGSWIKGNPNKLNNPEANMPGRVSVQYVIGSSFILCIKSSDGRPVIYTRWRHVPCPFVYRELGHVFLAFGRLAHTHKREAYCPQVQDRISVLIWLHSCSSSIDHLLSRVCSVLRPWQSTAKTTKEEPAHRGQRGGWEPGSRWGVLTLPCGNRWALWQGSRRSSWTSLGYAEAYPGQIARF